MNRRAWLAVIGGLIALDVLEDRRHGVTLSQTLRHLFRTHTRTGCLVLAVAWLVLTAWLLPHLMEVVDDSLAELPEED